MKTTYDETDITLSTSAITTDAVDLTHGIGYSIHVVYAETVATLAGTIKVQESIDGETWFDVSGLSESLSGGSGSVLFNGADRFAKYVRVYTIKTTGSGTANIIIHSKGV